MSGEVCTDNRFEIIEAYKKKLIERTNIETSPTEMDEIDNILFRFWQMGWLPPIPHGRLVDADVVIDRIDMNIDLYGADFPITHARMRSFIEHAPTFMDAEE